jgi:hypothetical protein
MIRISRVVFMALRAVIAGYVTTRIAAAAVVLAIAAAIGAT